MGKDSEHAEQRSASVEFGPGLLASSPQQLGQRSSPMRTVVGESAIRLSFGFERSLIGQDRERQRE